jgi:hypothetical protein
MKLSAKGLLTVGLHLGMSSHGSRREKAETPQPKDGVARQEIDNDNSGGNQSVPLSVLRSGEASGEGREPNVVHASPEAHEREQEHKHEHELEVEDLRPVLRRETKSHRPVPRRAPTRHSSCRGLVPPKHKVEEDDGPPRRGVTRHSSCRGLVPPKHQNEEDDGPPRRGVTRHSSCRALPTREEADARRRSLTRHHSSRTLPSRSGSGAGSSRLAVVRRTSSRTLARCHASSESLSASSSHDRSRTSASTRRAPARNPSNDTLESVDSSIQTVPSSDDEHDDDLLAKYEYEHMSGLEYGRSEEPSASRRKPAPRPSHARHPVRRPGSSHGPPSRTPSSSSLDAVEVREEVKRVKVEPSERLKRSSRARRSTPTVLKKCPPSTLRREASDSDSQTCGSTSTEGTSPSGSNRSGNLCLLSHSSHHQSMTDVISGLDELDSMLLGSSIHTTKSDPWG